MGGHGMGPEGASAVGMGVDGVSEGGVSGLRGHRRHGRAQAQVWWAWVGVGGGRGQGQRGQGWCVSAGSTCGEDNVGARDVGMAVCGCGREDGAPSSPVVTASSRAWQRTHPAATVPLSDGTRAPREPPVHSWRPEAA